MASTQAITRFASAHEQAAAAHHLGEQVAPPMLARSSAHPFYGKRSSSPRVNDGAHEEAALKSDRVAVELHHITPLLTVRTRDIRGAARTPATVAEALRVDRALNQALGPLWERVKEAGQALDDRVDHVADRIRLPPEGIHPSYVDAAKPLLRAALGKGATLAQQAVTGADTKLARLVQDAPLEVVPVLEDYFHNMRVDAALAPQSVRALEGRLPALGDKAARLLAQLRNVRSASDLAKLDASAARAIEAAATSDLLPLARALESAGVIVRESGFYSWGPGARAKATPRMLAALATRHYREETLGAALDDDRKYQLLQQNNERLIGSVEQKKIALASVGFDEVGRDWNSVVRYGQRLSEKFLDERHVAAASLRAQPRLDQREAPQVFVDHLGHRREDRIDADLERNYAPDVVLTSNHGTFHGHDGVREATAALAKLVPTQARVVDRLFMENDVIYETWSAKVDGKLVTGFGAYVIHDGRIAAQTLYYGVGSLK